MSSQVCQVITNRYTFPMPRRNDKLEVRIDPELKQAAEEYATAHGVSLGAIIRALLRRLVSSEDGPVPLPPGIEDELSPQSRRGRKRPPE